MKKRQKPLCADTQDAGTPPEVICCYRMKRADAVAFISMPAVAIFAIGILLQFPSENVRPVPTIAKIGILAFFVLLAGFVSLMAVRECRASVWADAEGLHAEGRRGKGRTIRWEEIDDYYKVITGPEQEWSGIVLGRDGTRIAIRSKWEYSGPLLRRVQERAQNARVRDWAQLGCRPQHDWPRTFQHGTQPHWVAPTVVAVVTLSCAVAATVCVFRGTVDTISMVGWSLCLTFTLLTALVLGLISAGFIYLATPDRLTRARQFQTITLTSDGLQVIDGENSLSARWEEVTDARLVSLPNGTTTRYVVQTINGSFDFTGRMPDSSVLAGAIVYNAPQVENWRIPEDHNALTVRQVVPSGVFVHHYRTFYNRLGLRVGWIWFFFPLALVPIAVENASPSLLPFLLWWSGATLVPLGWFIWRYFAARIDRDTDGLTFHTLFGPRYLLWSQITEFRLLYKDAMLCKYGLVGIIDSRAGRFVFFTNLSEKERLFRAIEAHLPVSTTQITQQEAHCVTPKTGSV